MDENNITWVNGIQQRITLDNTDPQRIREIIKENYVPKINRLAIANRLIENVKDRDTKMIMTKRELIDLVFKDNEESESKIKSILVKNRGSLNGYVSHIRKQLI
jgi:hypothetical protein